MEVIDDFVKIRLILVVRLKACWSEFERERETTLKEFSCQGKQINDVGARWVSGGKRIFLRWEKY